MDGLIDEQMDGWMHAEIGWMGEWTRGCGFGWMGEWMSGWVDMWMD